MVKKTLLDGSPCAKCVHAEKILKDRRLWDRISRVIIAEEGDASSEGMRLAAEYNVELAPFFIVEDGGEKRIYTKILEFIKKELEMPKTSLAPADSPPKFDIARAVKAYAALEPWEILADVQTVFGQNFAIAFSGAEDVVLIDMAVKNNAPFSVFCLDTGRLYPETHDFIDLVRERYNLTMEVYFPAPRLLEPFVMKKG